jgi:hypothetical protein
MGKPLGKRPFGRKKRLWEVMKIKGVSNLFMTEFNSSLYPSGSVTTVLITSICLHSCMTRADQRTIPRRLTIFFVPEEFPNLYVVISGKIGMEVVD